MNLKELLAKKRDELSAEELAFVKAHAAELSAEEKAKFEVEENGLDVDAVKNLVSKHVSEALEKQMAKISDELVGKFMKGVDEQRSRAVDTGKKPAAKSDNTTREFLKAIFAGDKARAKAITTETGGTAPDDSNAGVLIPVELRNEVLRIAETQYGLARRDMMYLPFSGPGNSRTIPALGTSVRVFWTDEKGKKTSTQPKFSLITQTLKKLAAIVPMTDEILEDSAINLTQLLGQLFAEAVAKEEDLQFFAGTGTPWTGLLNNGSLLTVTMTGVATDITADDLLDLQYKVPTSIRSTGKYYLSGSVIVAVQKLKGTDGHYIWQGPRDGKPGTIWNKPYEESDAFPEIGDVEDGEAFVIFGDLKKTCIFGDKQQLRVKLLEEATITDTDDESGENGDINLGEQDMVALRIVERVGYVCGLPGGLAKLIAGQES